MPLFLIITIILLFMLAAYIRRQPDVFRVSRNAIIHAQPEALYDKVNDFHAWAAWSPWATLDPNAKTEFYGAEAGEGAGMRWEGNSKVGKGSMTITDSRRPESIMIRLDFEKPMKATNTVLFTFVPDGAGTRVTWSMEGKNNLIGKIMSLFMNCEKMVGEKYEEGLANLARTVNPAPAPEQSAA